MLNLKKIIEKGSLRWIGQTYHGFSPQELVIAGISINSISTALGLTSYSIGRFRKENAFLVFNGEDIFYVYVNPYYSGYRSVFRKVVGKIPEGHDVDHVLSRSLAKHLKYRYVLMCMIFSSVNRRHGRIEKVKVAMEGLNNVPDICFADDRIFDKILSRKPEARRKLEDLLKGYNPESSPSYGLTLKQKGEWNSSFGFHLIDKDYLSKILTPIQLDDGSI